MNAKRPLSPPGGNQLQKRVRLTTHVPYRPCLHCGSPDHDYTKCMYECMHCTDEHFFRRCPELGVEHYEPKGFRPLLPPPTLEDQPSVVKPSTSGVVAQARQPSIETAVTQSAQVKPEPEPELAASTSVHDLPAAVLTPSPQQDSGEQDPRALCEGRRLYIGNMSYAATEADLKTFFRDYYVQSVRIPINPRTTRPVGYAFVDLYIPSQLEQAVSELDGKSLVDRKVSVQLAKPGSATPTRATSEVSGAATVKTKSRAAAVKTESRAATVKTESRAATVKTESGAVTVKTGGYPSSENRSHHTGVLKLPIAAAAAPETSTGSHHMDPSRAAMIAAALYGPQPVASKGHKQGPIYSGKQLSRHFRRGQKVLKRVMECDPISESPFTHQC